MFIGAGQPLQHGEVRDTNVSEACVFIGAGQPLQHGEVRDTNLA